MKFLTAILLLISMAFFLVQPVFALYFKSNCIRNCCPESTNNKKECPKNCNPLFTCIYCQYIPAKTIHVKNQVALIKSKQNTFYDSLIYAGYTTSCWHPPNYLLVRKIIFYNLKIKK